MSNTDYFMGLEDTQDHEFDWEKDSMYDNYGLE